MQAFLDERAEDIRRRYLGEGIGYTILARELGVSIVGMRRWLDEQGIRRGQADANLRRHQRYYETKKERDEEICRQRREGTTLDDIVANVGVSYKTVYTTLKRNGLTRSYDVTPAGQRPVPAKPLRGKPLLDAKRSGVVALINQGRTGKAIAREMGVAEGTLLEWLRINNLELKSRQVLTELQRRIVHTAETTNLSPAVIARLVKCSKTAVSRTLALAGIRPIDPKIGRPTGSVKDMSEADPPARKTPKKDKKL